MTIDIHSKFQGAMLGSALGDAIGELAFRFTERDQLLAEVEVSEKLIYTDDTAMAIALAESLVEEGDVDEQQLGDTFYQHYLKEPWRGYGAGPPQIFDMVEEEDISYVEAARRLYDGKGSMGNGAAMRITPLGLYYYNSDQLYEKAKASAQITHTHPIGIDGAAVQAKAIAITVGLNYQRPFSPRTFAESLAAFGRTTEFKDKLAFIPELIASDISADEAAARLGRGVAAHESMPFALYSFLRYPHTFVETILCAILTGGDRDTMGAMAGAVCGGYLGIEAIPVEWRRKLENNQHIETLARELAARAI
jgi:poly(ADP-ribose) glycohydrolase ARH3